MTTATTHTSEHHWDLRIGNLRIGEVLISVKGALFKNHAHTGKMNCPCTLLIHNLSQVPPNRASMQGSSKRARSRTSVAAFLANAQPTHSALGPPSKVIAPPPICKNGTAFDSNSSTSLINAIRSQTITDPGSAQSQSRLVHYVHQSKLMAEIDARTTPPAVSS